MFERKQVDEILTCEEVKDTDGRSFYPEKYSGDVRYKYLLRNEEILFETLKAAFEYAISSELHEPFEIHQELYTNTTTSFMVLYKN